MITRVLLLFLVAAAVRSVESQAAAPAHGTKTKRGDGFFKPVWSNALYSYYNFEMETKVTQTSTRFMPGSTDPADTGTIITAMAKLFDKDGVQRGLGSWERTIVGEDPEAPPGKRVVRALLSVGYEFGSAADGFFDDAIFVSIVTKREVADGSSDYTDLDTAIVGGAGRFLGATGKIHLRSGEFTDGTLVLTRIFTRFDIFVPALPKMLT